jgi:hypothetical protein
VSELDNKLLIDPDPDQHSEMRVWGSPQKRVECCKRRRADLTVENSQGCGRWCAVGVEMLLIAEDRDCLRSGSRTAADCESEMSATSCERARACACGARKPGLPVRSLQELLHLLGRAQHMRAGVHPRGLPALSRQTSRELPEHLHLVDDSTAQRPHRQPQCLLPLTKGEEPTLGL